MQPGTPRTPPSSVDYYCTAQPKVGGGAGEGIPRLPYYYCGYTLRATADVRNHPRGPEAL